MWRPATNGEPHDVHEQHVHQPQYSWLPTPFTIELRVSPPTIRDEERERFVEVTSFLSGADPVSALELPPAVAALLEHYWITWPRRTWLRRAGGLRATVDGAPIVETPIGLDPAADADALSVHTHSEPWVVAQSNADSVRVVHEDGSARFLLWTALADAERVPMERVALQFGSDVTTVSDGGGVWVHPGRRLARTVADGQMSEVTVQGLNVSATGRVPTSTLGALFEIREPDEADGRPQSWALPFTPIYGSPGGQPIAQLEGEGAGQLQHVVSLLGDREDGFVHIRYVEPVQVRNEHNDVVGRLEVRGWVRANTLGTVNRGVGTFGAGTMGYVLPRSVPVWFGRGAPIRSTSNDVAVGAFVESERRMAVPHDGDCFAWRTTFGVSFAPMVSCSPFSVASPE